MEEIQNFEKEEEAIEEAFGYRGERIFDKLTMYYFTHSWKFEILLEGVNHEFASPVIRTRHEDNFNFTWRFNYNKAARENYHNNFTISLLSFNKRHLEVCVRCHMDDGSYLKLLVEERSFDFSSEAPIQKESTLWDYDLQRIYQEGLVNLLKNKQNNLNKLDRLPLVIRVDFEFFEMDSHVLPSLKLADDLEALLKHNDELADVTFEIGGKELKAHKCILGARSSVFAKMFEVQEKDDDSRYRIEDIEPDVFQHLLNFVYCGKTDDAKCCNKLTELRLATEKFGLNV